MICLDSSKSSSFDDAFDDVPFVLVANVDNLGMTNDSTKLIALMLVNVDARAEVIFIFFLCSNDDVLFRQPMISINESQSDVNNVEINRICEDVLSGM